MAPEEAARPNATNTNDSSKETDKQKKARRTRFWIAVLPALIGVLTAAVSNWDKLYRPTPQGVESQPASAPQASEPIPRAEQAQVAATSRTQRAAQPRSPAPHSDPPSSSNVESRPSSAGRADPPPDPGRNGDAGPAAAAPAPAPAPVPVTAQATACEGTSSQYRAEASIRQTPSERAVHVVLKLTNISDRPLIVFGAQEAANYYGRLVDDSESNVYDVYANTTTAPRPPGNTPEETATYYSRRPEGGKRLDPRQTAILEYQPMKKLGQQWRRPTKYTFTVGIWVLVNEQAGYDARGDSLSCDVAAR